MFKGVDGVYVVSSLKKIDRLGSFLGNFGLSYNDVHVHEATEADDITHWTKDLIALFGRNTFGSNRYDMAESLTHYKLWQHIATTDNQLHIIFGDNSVMADIKGESPVASERFKSTWDNLIYPEIPADTTVLFLGGVLPELAGIYKLLLAPYDEHVVTFGKTTFSNFLFDAALDNGDDATERRWILHHMNAYTLTSRGAKLLVEMVSKHGFIKPAAHYLMRLMELDSPYVTYPVMVDSVPQDLPGVDLYSLGEPVLLSTVQQPTHHHAATAQSADVGGNTAQSAIGPITTVLLSVLGVPKTFKVDVEHHLTRAKLPFTYHSTLDSKKYADVSPAYRATDHMLNSRLKLSLLYFSPLSTYPS